MNYLSFLKLVAPKQPFSRLLFSLMLIPVVSIPIYGIGTVLYMLITGASYQEAIALPIPGTDGYSADATSHFLYLQIVQFLGFFLIPSLLIGTILQEGGAMRYLQADNWPQKYLIILSLAALVVIIPFVQWMAAFNASIQLPEIFKGLETWMAESEQRANEITNLFLRSDNIWMYLRNIVIMALLPAVGEEFLFRGILQRQIGDWLRNQWWGVILSALIFSAMHIQFFTFLPRFFLGIMLGYFFMRTKNIWVVVAVHFLNNAIAITIVAFTPFEGIVNFLEGYTGTEGHSAWHTSILFAGIFLFIILIILIEYTCRKILRQTDFSGAS